VKITVWGINSAPEPTGIGPFNTDLCAYLAERGHEVTLLTSFPYYPWWQKQPGYRGKVYSRKEEKGVTLWRCWHYVPRKPSTLKRLIHELTFVFFSLWPPLWAGLFGRRPDAFVVIGPPLFMGLGAFFVSRLLRRPFVFHVQDLQPDAAVGLGMIKKGMALKVLYGLEKWNYDRAALVSGISQGMLDAFTSKKVAAAKHYYFPNWIPDQVTAPAPNGASFRAAHAIPADAPLIAYSGNVGVKQGLEVVIEAAAKANPGSSAGAIRWAICGAGAAKPALQEMIENSPAKSSVQLYPLQPDEFYHALLREADVSLITQQRGTGQFFFPSKLLSILQYGRPVLAVADDSSGLARAVREGGFGLVVASGDAAGLLAAAEAMIQAPPEQKSRWAAQGRAWVDQFRRARVLGDFEKKMTELIGAG
jgi:colanic acid biosynthesis glycosyl transferase WcaI